MIIYLSVFIFTLIILYLIIINIKTRPFSLLLVLFKMAIPVLYVRHLTLGSERLKFSSAGIYTSDKGFLPWNIVTKIVLKKRQGGWYLIIETLDNRYSSTYLYFLMKVKCLKKILEGYDLKYLIEKE
ncbi:MAG: hypothetical protein MUF42_14250 [Cytophagaceae bacterium]|jgi:hypothetical protein|nr:hypothetical protein [Cytophagaceae bacterium]